MARPVDYGIPVISIGNLIVGGSGKTPMTIYLAKYREKVAVILRGYARESQGLYVISHHGHILEDVATSGDEAMLLAQSLPNATVIVSEDRAQAILKAKELGCKLVFLDDGFSKCNIHKFDILLRPKKEPTNLFCLPSGGYREPKMMYSVAQMVLQEGIDFQRVVTYKLYDENVSVLPNKLLLLTAISKATRLLEFLPEGVKLVAFEDHHAFTHEEIQTVLKENKGYSIITTPKDMVKLKQFNIRDLYLMDLELSVDSKVDFKPMNEYIERYTRF